MKNSCIFVIVKHEIIYTDDYALIVSDEKPLYDDYYFNVSVLAVRTGRDDSDYTEEHLKKVIGHRPLKDAPILEGVPLLPEFEDDDFLNTEIQVVGDNKTMSVSNFLKKYGKETYKYTEEDLRECCSLIFNALGVGDDITTDEIIQHIQQPKRPKYFECEMEPKYKHIGAVKGVYGSGFRKQNLMYGLPKTITNSQGQTEIVGKFF